MSVCVCVLFIYSIWSNSLICTEAYLIFLGCSHNLFQLLPVEWWLDPKVPPQHVSSYNCASLQFPWPPTRDVLVKRTSVFRLTLKIALKKITHLFHSYLVIRTLPYPIYIYFLLVFKAIMTENVIYLQRVGDNFTQVCECVCVRMSQRSKTQFVKFNFKCVYNFCNNL